jgi:hypothetical protein
MPPLRFAQRTLVALALSVLAACGDSSSGGSSSGFSGTFTAVEDTALKFEFKSGGKVVVTLGDLGSSTGTFTVDGEKILVDLEGQRHTFVRDGNCIEEPNHVFGKLCKGGKAGLSSNVSTRKIPNPPTGTWVAKTEEGDFAVEFKAGNKLSLSMTPPGGKPEAKAGKFVVEGDTLHATLDLGEPLILQYVNDGYESMSFGFPMRFVKQ